MIDYCTIFSGPNAGILARVMYNSLFRVSDVSDLRFHVIIKDVSDSDLEMIRRVLDGRPVEWYRSPRPKIQRGPKAGTLEKLPTQNCDDVGHTCDFILRHCGYSQWCILAHFDMVYEKDFLSLCRGLMAPDVGQIGQHEKFLLLNRRAYYQSSIKFTSLSSFVAVPAWPAPTHGQYNLRFKDDPRITAPIPPPTTERYDYNEVVNPIQIRGFDTGDLLELELQVYGWKVYPMLLELRDCITHFGGGGSAGVVGYDEQVMVTHRDRALRLIEERGL